MKKLICAKEVEEIKAKGEKTFYIDGDTIITPSAKDAAKAYGITFSTEAPCCGTAPCQNNSADGGIDQDLIYQVMKALSEKGMLSGLFDAPCGDKPYCSEHDANGLKVVRGKTVNYEVFETGNPADKVFYQEIINAEDGCSMNAGFITIEECSFDWECACQELYHVVEGTLTVKTDSKLYTMNPGDSVFFPKGAKVRFGSPDKMKAFYATY